ncbi:Hypothetical predicted protein [Cloeon dipterum]|uniref:BTB domain-containing protein n=1 Tax=Cloeon dipterum TaxID=197152 RepID=A0A8S1CZZ2_9INSE|nr:Hypothetical predicted protein [Cloeon dipterum]
MIRGTESCFQHLHFMSNLFRSGKDYDCSFKVGTKVFRCHKQIFSWASPPFKAMLQSTKFKEACNNPDEIIDLTDISEEAFEFFLEYLYERTVEFPSLRIAVEAHFFAHVWNVECLEKIAEHYLDQIQPGEYCNLYILSKRVGNVIIRQRIKEKICLKFERVVESPMWRNQPDKSCEILIDVLSDSDCKFNIRSEMQFAEAVVELKVKDRAIIGKIIRLIRFYTVDCKDFINFIRKHPLLSPDILTIPEAQSIAMSIAQKEPLLPAGFSHITESRKAMKERHDVCWKYQTIEKITPNIETTLTFWVEDDVYLLEIYLDSLKCNRKTIYNYEVLLMSGEQILSTTIFRGFPMDHTRKYTNENQQYCIELNYPILLKAEVPYKLVVSNRLDEGFKMTLRASIRNRKKAWKSSVTNIHFIGSNKTGEIFGLSLALPHNQ